jgi:hypothetical protein
VNRTPSGSTSARWGGPPLRVNVLEVLGLDLAAFQDGIGLHAIGDQLRAAAEEVAGLAQGADGVDLDAAHGRERTQRTQRLPIVKVSERRHGILPNRKPERTEIYQEAMFNPG